MGRILRSLFVVIGVACLWMNVAVAIQGLALGPGLRAPTIGFGFAMQMASVGFIVLLQKPFFASIAPRAPSNWRRALAVLFGLLLLYPGVCAGVIGLADAGAGDAAAMLGLGAVMLATAFAFIVGAVGAILRGLPEPLEPEDF